MDDAIEALAVVIDDPPEVSDLLLPAFEQRLEDIAFVQLRIAHQRDHPTRAFGRVPAMRDDVILDQAGKGGDRDAQCDARHR